MMTPEQRANISRENFRNQLPQIQLIKCRVEKSTDSSVRRLIIDGNPVLAGAVLPRVDIGGLTPLKLVSAAKGTTAIGVLQGELQSRKAIIDYGFTRGECVIEEIDFGEEENDLFNDTSRLPIPRTRGIRLLRKVTNALAAILWKIKKMF